MPVRWRRFTDNSITKIVTKAHEKIQRISEIQCEISDAEEKLAILKRSLQEAVRSIK